MSQTSTTSSSIMKTLQKPWVIGTIAVVAAAVAYAVAFDARRRLDPKFRKQLRKQQKKVEQQQQARALSNTNGSSSTSDVPTVESILNESLPTTPEGKERYFLEQLTRGENFTKKGPHCNEVSAACFYKALKVYPSPADLLMLFQRTLPDDVFQMIMKFISSEVQKRQQVYYVVFPPPEMNVRIEEDKEDSKKKMLLATKESNVGEVIYIEEPIVGSLQPSLLLGNKHCHYCFKLISDASRSISTRTKLAFCSNLCETTAWDKYDQLMYSDHSRSEGSTTEGLVHYCSEKDTVIPLLIAKFLAYMVYEDQSKNQQLDVNEFGIWDHLERMKYLSVSMTEKERKIEKKLRSSVGKKIPGFEEFLTDERYLSLKGKFLYNQYSVVSGSHDKTTISDELQRGAIPSATGVGLYPVSTYLNHSCVPNAKIEFLTHDFKLHLIATKPIAVGDELQVTFIDPSQSFAERKRELFKWRLSCACDQCQTEELEEEDA